MLLTVRAATRRHPASRTMMTQRGEMEVQYCGVWGVKLKPRPQDQALHQVDCSVMIDEMIMRGGWSFSMMLGFIVPFYDIGVAISAGSRARAKSARLSNNVVL